MVLFYPCGKKKVIQMNRKEIEEALWADTEFVKDFFNVKDMEDY